MIAEDITIMIPRNSYIDTLWHGTMDKGVG